MRNQRPKRRAAGWRARREAYLRESGRQMDLILEGFEPAPPTLDWTVLTGGRASRPKMPSAEARLFLVKLPRS